MRKYSLIFLLAFCTGVIHAQLKIGVFGEPRFSWFGTQSKSFESDGTHFGFQGGLELNKYFAKRYAFNTGISIGNQGGSLTYSDTTNIKVLDETKVLLPGTTVDFSLQYITIPVALKLSTNQIGYFTYFARLGFTPQVNVHTKASSSDGQLDKDNVNKEINVFNLSYFFGGGVEYEIGQETALALSATFHNGFLDIITNKDAKVYSRVISIRLGIIF